MPRLKLTLAYVGTKYHGWQVQDHKNTQERPTTIQGCLEAALAKLIQQPVRVHGSGRTDAGVHALAQVAHVDVPEEKLHIDFQKALNHLLPKDISIIHLKHVDEEFHARYSAKNKIYTYSLWLTRRYVLPQRRAFVWDVGPLNLAAMDQAAELLLGTHDFAGFQNQGTEVKSTVRTISDISRVHVSELELAWTFQADGFLKQMVRNLAGCLVAVGRKKLPPEAVRTLLEQQDRTKAPATAPPRGLTMVKVLY